VRQCDRHGHCRAGGTIAGLSTRLYVTPRQYAIPFGLLHPAGGPPNVLAVRVVSYGGKIHHNTQNTVHHPRLRSLVKSYRGFGSAAGKGEGVANATNMTAGGEYPPFGTTFPGGFYDDPNLKAAPAGQRIGPFDAAVSPGE
jgi:hypothetical protein